VSLLDVLSRLVGTVQSGRTRRKVSLIPPDPTIVDRLRAAGCVFAEDEARLLASAAGSPDELAAMVERRIAGLPLEHILGWVEFAGLRIAVDPGVFVPRQRTELLVREAAALAAPGAVVVDLCCGCGALGVALASLVPDVELVAADVSANAVRCARRNVTGRVYQGDLFDALPESLRGRVDILLANVPYVPTEAIATMPPEARDHEPQAALDGGADGLTVFRRVASGAPEWLAPGGHVLMETGESQVATAVSVLAAAGLTPRVIASVELFSTGVVGTR
jgi:release factor glutamine methyltransferase